MHHVHLLAIALGDPLSGAELAKWEWAEFKDVAKQFLTLIVAVLVFSVTFSEKIIDFPKATKIQRGILLTSWGLMVASIIGGGLGLWLMYQAVLDVLIGREGGGIDEWIRMAYVSINLGGVAFVLGLFGLVVTAFLSLRWKPSSQ